MFAANLREMVDFGPEHLSVYGLTVYEGTEFDRRRRAGNLRLPDEDTQAEMFLAARRRRSNSVPS